MPNQLSADRIMELGFGFMASKTQLSANELGLFTELAGGPVEAEALRARLGLHPRSARDFFDSLVALGLLRRRDGRYSNTRESDLFLDRGKPEYVGGVLEMCNARLYRFWGSLTEGLRTGKPQNEIKAGEDMFDALYGDPEALKAFCKAMTGRSLIAARAIAKKFPWRHYQTFADLGTAEGVLPAEVALAHKHLNCVGFDLPPVRGVFEEYVASRGVADRVRFQPGDFFKDPMPRAQVLSMGANLHDWDLDRKRALIGEAYEALPDGGA